MSLTVGPRDPEFGSASASSWAAWAEHELGSAELGDARRTKRLVRIMSRFMAKPLALIPGASVDWAEAKATYRFMDNAKVEADAILAPHRVRTLERAASHEVVLAIGDTAMLDYTDHPRTIGLGPLADLKHQGLLLHPTLVVTPERVPLGLIDHFVWTRNEETFATGEKSELAERPIEEKESFKWLRSLESAENAQEALKKSGARTLVVSVFDREGDVFDVLAKAANTSCALLVRAMSDRRVDHEERYLWDTMDAQEPAGRITINLPRTPKRKARDAELVIRFGTVTLRPPRNRRVSDGLVPVAVQVVYASEVNTPADAEPIQWMLLTTVAVRDLEGALQVLRWYCCRWSIELFFRVLKSGCKTEERQLETAERLKRCLIVDSIVAWRVLYLTTCGRDTPDLPCEVVFEEHEWKALYFFVHRSEAKVPSKPPPLREVTRLIGRLGGHLGRKGDGEPGQTTVWRGLTRLSDISNFFLIMRRPGSG